MSRLFLNILVFCALALTFCTSSAHSGEVEEIRGANSLQLEFFTTPLATTPQLPFWRAISAGDFEGIASFNPIYWKNLDDLRSLLLAGKGDVWLGHVEGFAQAALRGAPVTLLAVTGWRKFYILTSRDDLQTMEDVLALPNGERMSVTPPQSPGLAVLKALQGKGVPDFLYTLHEARQLAMETMRGRVNLLMAPEPTVTRLLIKAPQLRVVASVEELYGAKTGSEPYLPIAGFGVRTDLCRSNPELCNTLSEALVKRGGELVDDPIPGVEALPESFSGFFSRETVLASMERDVVRVRLARDCRKEVLTYLGMVYPQVFDVDGRSMLPEGFFAE